MFFVCLMMYHSTALAHSVHILLALILIFANCRHDVSFCAMVCNGMGILYAMFYNGILFNYFILSNGCGYDCD